MQKDLKDLKGLKGRGWIHWESGTVRQKNHCLICHQKRLNPHYQDPLEGVRKTAKRITT